MPNFVTLGKVTGELINVNYETGHEGLSGKIALIENADPGFDWLLGTDIQGFITCFGGANSHMAVRAMELNLPAAIGIGERLFNQMLSAKNIELDCVGRRLVVLS